MAAAYLMQTRQPPQVGMELEDRVVKTWPVPVTPEAEEAEAAEEEEEEAEEAEAVAKLLMQARLMLKKQPWEQLPMKRAHDVVRAKAEEHRREGSMRAGGECCQLFQMVVTELKRSTYRLDAAHQMQPQPHRAEAPANQECHSW